MKTIQSPVQTQSYTHPNSSILLKIFVLLAMLVVGVNAWGQDATFDMGQVWEEKTINNCKLTFTGGSYKDVHTDTGITDLSTETDSENQKNSAFMTISREGGIRYIRITFGDSNTYYLKWGGGNDAKNKVAAKDGSLILISNWGSNDIKIINDIEKGTETTPIKKVEVFYQYSGFSTDTGAQTAANATKTVSGLTCINNTIPLDKINVIGQYCSFSSTNGHGIMMNTSEDHYLSIKFASAMDLHEMTSFVIDGTNVTKTDNSGIFNSVLFYDSDGKMKVGKYNNPANATDFTDEQKQNLSSIKEIRLFNDVREGVFTINSITLNFGGSHVKTTPVLNNGTTSDMTIFEGDALTLSATNGYWREFTDNTYTSERNYESGSPILDNRWSPEAPFDGTILSKLTVGEHYFGIKDANNCTTFNEYHSSELVKVKVTVRPRYTVTFSANNSELGSVTASVNGNTINSGDKVNEGAEVTFTATPSGENLFYNWDGADFHQKQITRTVSADLNITATFTAGVYIEAQTNNANLGTVSVQNWQTSSSSRIHTTPYPGKVTFTATPTNVGKFVGWYEEEGRTSLKSSSASYVMEGSNQVQSTNVTLYAKFEPIIYISSQPVEGTNTVSQTPTALTVTASAGSGNACSYQWQQKSGGNWSNIDGATTSSYSPPQSAVGTRTYRCVINAEGCDEVYTNEVNVITIGTIDDLVETGDNYTYVTNESFVDGSLYSNNKIISKGGGEYRAGYGLTLNSTKMIAFKVPNGYTVQATMGNYGNDGEKSIWLGTSSTGDTQHTYTQTVAQGQESELKQTLTTGGVVYLSASGDLYLKELKVAKLKTITYNVNGGTCSTSSFVQTSIGESTELPTPTRDNYTFDGWYTAAENGSNVGVAGASYTPATDITLYAHWTLTNKVYKSDLGDHGGIGGSVTWSEGTLTTSAGYDNMANIFVFEKAKDVSADNFTGLSITAKGDNFRIIVYVDGESDAFVYSANDCSDANKIYTLDWSDFYTYSNVQLTNIADIARVCVAGYQGSNGTSRSTTFSNAYLLKNELKQYALATFPTLTNSGNVISSAYDSGEKVVKLNTKGNSNHYIKLMDISDGDMCQYTGVRFDTKGERFRVIVKTTDNKTFIGHIDQSSGFKTQHLVWSDFSIQWGDTPMTADDVAKIKEFGIGGDDDNPDATNDQFQIRHLWFDNIADYDHTIVCYGEEGGNYAATDEYKGIYTYTSGDASAAFSDVNGGSRIEGTNDIKLDNAKTITLSLPSGNKFTSVKLVYRDGDQYANYHEVIAGQTSSVFTLEPSEFGEQTRTITITNKSSSTIAIEKIIYSSAPANPEGYQKISVTYDDKSKDREFIVYAPSDLSGNVPVLFSLHGTSNDYTGSGVQNYNSLAEQDKFIVVYPRGLERDFPVFGANQVRGWLANGQYNEDVKFFEDVISWLKTNSSSNYNCTIDEYRIYMTGYSNGGMMTYSTAFTSDKFAAFSSISGLQLNEFHMQHFGGNASNPGLVPFLHIHGTKDDFVKYTLMPTIVDNMVYRNGCNPVPEVYKDADGGSYWIDHEPYYQRTGLKKSTYTSTIDKNVQYIYYEIGSGMSSGDTGMGHNAGCDIDENGDGTYTPSTTIMWNFMKQYTKSSTPTGGLKTYSNDDKVVFKPMVETKGFNASEHGWAVNSGTILAQYGETSSSANNKQNVYHSLQLRDGDYSISFDAECEVPDGRYVTVKIERLATIDESGETHVSVKTVVEKHYEIAEGITCRFDTNDNGLAEYRISILVGGQENVSANNRDEDGNPRIPVVVSNIVISQAAKDASGTEYTPPVKTDFTGYFNYHNRLTAQWNFDLCDDASKRFLLSAISNDNQYWNVDYSGTSADHKYGTIVCSYKKVLDGGQLTYDGCTLVPATAGLKFTAGEGQVKIHVSMHNGKIEGVQLVVESGVKMTIPYVRNSYRADTDSKFDLHHINRDIVYIASSPDIWNAFDNSASIFGPGGVEYVDGKTWEKCNFNGEHGTPCTITFTTKTTFDRIGVNRNLLYSFYTEHIATTTGYDKPFPGLRVIGSPRGGRIANQSTTYATYGNAIAMTYGGWVYKNSKVVNEGNEYHNGEGTKLTDTWSELEVNEIENGATTVPIATDGFPIISTLKNVALSETVNPEDTGDAVESGHTPVYHAKSGGAFFLTERDGGSCLDVPNVTPWSLPCRGAYVKFEPTIPGVLNVHILQEGGKVYYIADEYGHLVKSNVYTKTGIGASNPVTFKDNKAGHFIINTKDYVKYSFDVYPGKSYYLFSNEAPIGVAGFNFEPYVYRKYNSLSAASSEEAYELDRDDVYMQTTTLEAGATFSTPTGYEGPLTSAVDNFVPSGLKDDDTKVKACNNAFRVSCPVTFVADKWNSICLPFSMNNLQVKEVFGEGTKLVLLRDIQEAGTHGYYKTTANFLSHVNQDILAGYPYLIYPTKSVSSIVANVYLGEGERVNTPSIISINGIGQNTVTYPTGVSNVNTYYVADSNYNYGGMNDYEFVGVLSSSEDNATASVGSYIINNGGFTRVTATGTNVSPFQAYIRFKGTAADASKRRIQSISIGVMDGNNTVTDIEDVLLDAGVVGAKTNVYNMQGQMVRQNTDDLTGLPKGVYIVNGKKYLVR